MGSASGAMVSGPGLMSHYMTASGRYVNAEFCPAFKELFSCDTESGERVYGADVAELVRKGAKVYGTEKAARMGEKAYWAKVESKGAAFLARKSFGLPVSV